MLRKFDYSGKFWQKAAWGLVLLLCIGMAERKLGEDRCKNLVIRMKDESGMRFLEPVDVEALLTERGTEPIQGSKLGDVDLKLLEAKAKQNRLVRNCEVFRDLQGNIVAEVEQQKPIGRWINASVNGEWRKSVGFYINEEGEYLPLSDRYTARTLLISGDFFKRKPNLKTRQGKQVLDLIRYLNENELWKAQVTELIIDKDGEVDLFTTIGDQRIEFGNAENIESKFKKLHIFYEKVLASDWSRYSKISIKFQDQIVCE
jgi:cell division protein FtsQ